MDELKKRIRKTGMTQKEFCEKIPALKGKYQTFNSYINGFNPMPDHIRQEIEDVLMGVEE